MLQSNEVVVNEEEHGDCHRWNEAGRLSVVELGGLPVWQQQRVEQEEEKEMEEQQDPTSETEWGSSRPSRKKRKWTFLFYSKFLAANG